MTPLNALMTYCIRSGWSKDATIFPSSFPPTMSVKISIQWQASSVKYVCAEQTRDCPQVQSQRYCKTSGMGEKESAGSSKGLIQITFKLSPI